MRRLLSAGVAGMVILGAGLSAAHSADQAGGTVVDSGVIVTSLENVTHAYKQTTKLGLWGVPTHITVAANPTHVQVLTEQPTLVPASQPAVEIPAPESPASQTPAAESPTVETPAVQAPASETPAAESPKAEEAASPAPVVEAPKAAAEAPKVVESVATAPVVEAPKVVESVATAPVVEAPKVAQTPAPVATEVKPAAATTTVIEQPALVNVSNQAKRDAAVAAAKGFAAINAQTDCTALVTNSLAAAGINFHGWPADYLSLGRTVSAAEAQPGDIIYYASNGFGSSHIALYLGNGMAVHGGWNGMGTTIFSAYLPSASAPVFISPSAYQG